MTTDSLLQHLLTDDMESLQKMSIYDTDIMTAADQQTVHKAM